METQVKLYKCRRCETKFERAPQDFPRGIECCPYCGSTKVVCFGGVWK